MADGTLAGLSGRGLRPLDAARVEAIRQTLDPTADFAEDARRTLADLVDRFRDTICGGDLAHCRQRLADALSRLDALSPAALTRAAGSTVGADGSRPSAAPSTTPARF